MFFGCTLPSDSKETELGSSDQEASPSAGKNTGVVLVPCSRMEVHPYSYFRWCGYFWGSWVSFVTTDEFSMRVTKITSRIGVSSTHSLPFYFFSKFKLNELWPYYQKHLNQIIFEAFVRISWMFPWIKLSWNSCSVGDKPGWLNWFWQFLCEKLSSFNLEGF